MSDEQIKALLQALEEALRGNVVDRLTITIKPKANTKQD